MSDKRLAWHFLKSDWTTGEGGLLVKVGEPMVHEGVLKPCYSGLHASDRLIDALKYAPSSLITRVECLAPYVDHTGDDKFVCRTRVPMWGYDAQEELRLFARLCAKDVLGNWQQDIPEVVLKWLETGDPDLRSAAESAARSAAESAARSAESAAWSAWSAAWSARSARSAARSAESAAWSAWSAAWSAAESAQNERLERLINEGAISRGLITLEDLKKVNG